MDQSIGSLSGSMAIQSMRFIMWGPPSNYGLELASLVRDLLAPEKPIAVRGSMRS